MDLRTKNRYHFRFLILCNRLDVVELHHESLLRVGIKSDLLQIFYIPKH